MSKIIKEVQESLINLKRVKPLVHCITNYITANDCANAILAVGGSPAMADAIEEVEQMATQAQALVLNLGTIANELVDAMIKAGKAANKAGVPVVFDPVGVGATNYRKESTFRLLKEVKFSVIRGNMAEIKVLCGMESNSKGVDSVEDVKEDAAKDIARELAKKLNTVVAITGVIDYISDGERVITIRNGNEMLTRVTGTGCMTTALIGAYLGGGSSPLHCAVAGVATMGMVGEIAFDNLKENQGSGSFRVSLIDGMYNLKEADFQNVGKINE
ncbi:hydroxyethylthiazole kinase [Clostridium vincentii]|uniref:Hydroxyethylthiazole kinase n=1 Tax=Clostridium vincentii TaxID=52704 RepID=A0A2T0BEW4_9CLOT|nr:hydroxyethylthiazole kinase [Clostridium vincentii]PRR82357.1 Hydroxyethylthiazole kinase [Clostridium vincentii]